LVFACVFRRRRRRRRLDTKCHTRQSCLACLACPLLLHPVTRRQQPSHTLTQTHTRLTPKPCTPVSPNAAGLRLTSDCLLALTNHRSSIVKHRPACPSCTNILGTNRQCARHIMAYTRHGSRVSDTTSARRHGRRGARLSPAADAPDASANIRVAEMVEISEGADESSPNPEALPSRSTGGFCIQCGSQIGDFYNSWRRIDRTLYVPALAGSYSTRRLKVCARGQKSLLNGPLKAW
jgi:hypothetical protein